MFAEVSFPIARYPVFTYRIPESLEGKVSVGSLVMARLGSVVRRGIVSAVVERSPYEGKIRPLEALLDEASLFTEETRKLFAWLRDYYLAPSGLVIQAMVPPGTAAPAPSRRQFFIRAMEKTDEAGELLRKKAPKQHALWHHVTSMNRPVSLEELREAFPRPLSLCRSLARQGWVEMREEEAPDVVVAGELAEGVAGAMEFPDWEGVADLREEIHSGRGSAHLLKVPAGLDRVAIYLALAREAQEAGRGAIVLFPEIALAAEAGERFRALFGDRVALWHGELRPAERARVWRRMVSGAVSVVVGTRGAVFAPLKRLGFLAVDEEHEGSYKQDRPAPCYHARDVALVRGRMASAAVLLASSTPSLESLYNCSAGKLRLLAPPPATRLVHNPSVHVVDLTKESRDGGRGFPILSAFLKRSLDACLARGEQAVILQNRRGFASAMRCEDCGAVEECRWCQIVLVYHAAREQMVCHLCGRQFRVPAVCAGCGGTRLRLSGGGTQRVEAELARLFPAAKVARYDLDTATTRHRAEAVLAAFSRREFDLLIGTRMAIRGLNLPGVTLVAVANADLGLLSPDFRAGEHAFQMLYRTILYSSREEHPPDVVLQTFSPENPVIRWAARLGVEQFANIALGERKEVGYPPFSWMARIEFRGRKEETVASGAAAVRADLGRRAGAIQIIGSAPCPIARIRGEARHHIILRSLKEDDRNGARLHRLLQDFRFRSLARWERKGVAVLVDVDPSSLL